MLYVVKSEAIGTREGEVRMKRGNDIEGRGAMYRPLRWPFGEGREV